jgi:hypothetical protein
MSTTSEALALVRVAHAVAETIRELGAVPSGHLYARLMGVMELHQYEQVIDLLIDARLIERDRRHLLRWIGPAVNPNQNPKPEPTK